MKRTTQGGTRPGAGRPKGAKNKEPAEGRKVITASVSMLPTQWAKLDDQRGAEPRGKYIARKLNL